MDRRILRYSLPLLTLLFGLYFFLFNKRTITLAQFKELYVSTEFTDESSALFKQHFTTPLPNFSRNETAVEHQTLESLPFWNIPLRRTITPRNDICMNVSLLVAVRCRPMDFETRQKFRETYGRYKVKQNFSMIFVIGLERSIANQQRIQEESEENGDILQSSFIDAFRNITFKTTSALLFHRDFCAPSTIMFRTDDDVFWTVSQISLAVAQFRTMRHGLAGRKKTDESPVRVPSKWQATVLEYPGRVYPTFCDGFAWFIHHDATIALLSEIPRAPFLWLDDVFITGVVRERARIEIADFPSAMSPPIHFHSNISGHLKHFIRVYGN